MWFFFGFFEAISERLSYRKFQCESSPLSPTTLKPEPTSMESNNLVCDRQTQAGSFFSGQAGIFGAEEFFKHIDEEIEFVDDPEEQKEENENNSDTTDKLISFGWLWFNTSCICRYSSRFS